MARPRSTCAPGVARKGLPDQAKISHVIPGVPPAGLDRAVARGRVGDRDLGFSDQHLGAGVLAIAVRVAPVAEVGAAVTSAVLRADRELHCRLSPAWVVQCRLSVLSWIVGRSFCSGHRIARARVTRRDDPRLARAIKNQLAYTSPVSTAI